MKTQRISTWLGVATVTVLTAPAIHAQPVPDYGLTWRVVGDPGNRATLPTETPLIPEVPIGAVPYEFRITDTKLSNVNYLEFVQAYASFWEGSPDNLELTGIWINGSQNPDGSWVHRIRTGAENYGARITWEMSARYVNWLQNGKVNERWAFENGVYDTSTFYRDAQGRPQHQLVPSPGARFWIPTLDEWVKAAYWDPNRDGQGMGGYWHYPDSGDDPMIEGLPEAGGETIGDLMPSGEFGQWPLRQYPNVQSPWGLIDISATVPDYTSTLDPYSGVVMSGGSLAGDPLYIAWDQLLGIYTFFPNDLDYGWNGGLRVASVVPAPGAAASMLCFMLWFRRRSKR